MTDQTNQDQEQQTEAADELALLKARATQMGISFSNNIKVETLRTKIQEKLNADDAELAQDTDEDEQDGPAESVQPNEAPKAARKKTLREELLESQMKLVRCRISNMDPKKRDLPGEIFTIANEYIGTVRKFVPYGEATDEGYHIPFCIYTDLESRRFQNIRVTRDRRTGQTKTETSFVKEFAIEILPDLTAEELAALAQAQQAAGSIESASNTDYMV